MVSLFPHPASFRFRLTTDTLAFGYLLPATGRIRVFHPLETCAAGRTHQRRVSAFAETLLSHVDLYFAFTASAAAFAARRPEVTAHATQLDGMDSSPCTPPMTSPHA